MNAHGLIARLRSTARKATGLNRRSDGTPYIRRSVGVPLAAVLVLAVGASVAADTPDSAYWGSTVGDESVQVEADGTVLVNVTRNSPVPGLNIDLKVTPDDAPKGVMVTVIYPDKLQIDPTYGQVTGDFEVGYTVTGVDPDTGETHRSYEVVHVNAGGAAR